MNRSTFTLGFALLVIAATLAASITMRNAPVDTGKATRHDIGAPKMAQPRALAARGGTAGATADPKSRNPHNQTHHQEIATKVQSLHVTLPEPWLNGLPTEQQAEWRTRTDTVERAAHKKLERLTTDLDLNAAQIDKMFPLIVRSTPGYASVMLTGGNLTATTPVAANTPVAAAEEIHQVLDPQQQTLAENQEVNRQLWWQDTLSRLEADLIDSTGGIAATITAAPTEEPTAPAVTTPAVTAPATEERVAPEARDDGNLFDLLDSNR